MAAVAARHRRQPVEVVALEECVAVCHVAETAAVAAVVAWQEVVGHSNVVAASVRSVATTAKE